MIRSRLTSIACLPAVCAAVILVLCAPAQANFGVKNFDLTFSNADGSPDMEAGSHPFAVTNVFEFNTHVDPVNGEVPDGQVKDITVSLPEGLVGDPGAVPRCSSADFIHFNEETKIPKCSDDSAVGVIVLKVLFSLKPKGVVQLTAPVYNLVPPPGVIQKFGFIAYGIPVTMDFTVRPSDPYNVIVKLHDIAQPAPLLASTLTIWGDPASPIHDFERGHCISDAPGSEGPTGESCPSSVAEKPFITVPRACNGPLVTGYEVDSWEEPGKWLSGIVLTHDDSVPPVPFGFDGCFKLNFEPTISSRPTTEGAESPTGLDFGLNVYDEGLTSPTGLAQSDVKKAVVTLPEGMTANPSLAEGLTVCSPEALARETVDSAPGEGCPQESKIGTVEVETPLLEEPLKGSLFMASPYANPFKSLLAMYFVIKNPALGIIIKQPAEIEPNASTGRISTVVEDIPQLPFSHFKLRFREGARSPLVSPPACGAYDAEAELTPWSGGAPVTTSSMFQIIVGANDGPCPLGGVPPFSPQVLSGTLDNNAGNYSPFYLRISRNDGEQELTKFTTTFPAGLTGNLSGIPFCPDAAIESARLKTGAQETDEPSCPASSEIGHTLVGAGVGPTLAWAPGKVYLAGPYHGSALSVVSITSATVGPFDLGTVVIRFALRINPITAQVEIDSTGSDPIPHIIDGIVVHVREIHVYVDRQKFILNPTSCNPLSITNAITGAGADIASPTDDTTVEVTSRFQAADCSNLSFKPSFKASTTGKTSRAKGASLTVKLAYPKAPQGTQANIKSVHVELPRALPSRLSTLNHACPDSVFNQNPASCPAQSRVGYAKAVTPVLPVPLEGPAFFVSHGGQKFPELIVVLQGYGVTVYVEGETFINKAGITSSTFRSVPDVPVGSFELTLPEGPFSALAANRDLCTSSLAMPAVFDAQNGARLEQKTPIEVQGCQYSLRILNRRVHKRTLTLKVSVPVAGKLVASGKGVSKAGKKSKGRQTLTLMLKERHGGKLRTKITLRFTPKGATGRQRGKGAKVLRKSQTVRFH